MSLVGRVGLRGIVGRGPGDNVAMQVASYLKLSVAVALLTIGLKTGAWWWTGSVSLAADALESFVNLAGALFALAMVTVARRPPDADHPFGHHKAEFFSSGFEGVLIIGAALGIAWTALQRLLAPQPVQGLDLGLTLSLLSTLLNGALAWAMLRNARAHRSMALEADARHLFTDVWTSCGVMLGLLAVWVTGWLWLDPLLALLVAANILREGVHLVWRSSQGLMDEAIDAPALTRIQAALDGFARQQPVRFDHVASRNAGRRRFVDLHMHLPADWSLARAAALRAQVEQALVDAVPGLHASIQLLPLGVEARHLIQDKESS